MKLCFLTTKVLSTTFTSIAMFIFIIILFGTAHAEPLGTSLVRIQDHLFYLDIPKYKNKVVVAEFDDYVVVIESPHNDFVALEILNTCEQAFPNKPPKYLFHTHHHAHSIAGVDPYFERMVTIVTSPFNLKTIRKKTIDNWTLARSVILFDSVYTLSDQVNELRALLIYRSEDQYPVPTEEFIVVYFPRQQVLVSGCLYNKPFSSHEIINERKLALRRFITANNLDVKYLVPTTTDSLAGFENICTIEMLNQTLKEGVNPDSVSIGLQRLSIEYIESKRDSLVEYFGNRIPRIFDLQILIRYLYEKYNDPNRGIQLAKVASAVHPECFKFYRWIGYGYRLRKEYIEALAFYEKSLALAESQSNSRWVAIIREDIQKTVTEMEGHSKP